MIACIEILDQLPQHKKGLNRAAVGSAKLASSRRLLGGALHRASTSQS
jgi:hypothetical protein